MAQNHHPEDLKAEVRKTGISLAELARRHGMVGGTGSRALYEPCPRMNRAIADHLGVSVHALWPEWFDADGERILRFDRKSISGDRTESRQKRRAA
jgi:lambda repressor-like predicted transcriptional regulator